MITSGSSLSFRSLDSDRIGGLESNLTGVCLLIIIAPAERPRLSGMMLRLSAERHIDRAAMLCGCLKVVILVRSIRYAALSVTLAEPLSKFEAIGGLYLLGSKGQVSGDVSVEGGQLGVLLANHDGCWVPNGVVLHSRYI